MLDYRIIITETEFFETDLMIATYLHCNTGFQKFYIQIKSMFQVIVWNPEILGFTFFCELLFVFTKTEMSTYFLSE